MRSFALACFFADFLSDDWHFFAYTVGCIISLEKIFYEYCSPSAPVFSRLLEHLIITAPREDNFLVRPWITTFILETQQFFPKAHAYKKIFTESTIHKFG